MKKTYLTPDVRTKDIMPEENFLHTGRLNPGFDPLDDPEDENPWNN